MTPNITSQFKQTYTHTSILYQIFTPAKNKEIGMQGNDVEIGGMLLYARTTSEIQPDYDYVMSGNTISLNANLNPDFCVIRNQVDIIICDNFHDERNY